MVFDNGQIVALLIREFEKIKDEIIAGYNAKNMKASGDLEESGEVVSEATNSVSLKFAKHIEQMQFGRRAGAVSREGLDKLYDWIIDKRLMEATEKAYKIRGLAYVIARKIAKEGYDRANYGGVNLVDEIITDQRIKDIINLVASDVYPIFEANFKTMLTELRPDGDK